MRGFLVAVFLATTLTAPAQESNQQRPQTQTYWTAGVGAIGTQKWLGSSDIRRGGHYFVSYNRPEPRFRLFREPGAISIMGYYTMHKGGNIDGRGGDTLYAFGVLATARFWNRDNRRLPTFYEIGWGLHFSNRWVQDIDTPISSTPTAGIGLMVDIGGEDVIFALRWMHISNAGLGRSNRGQNGLIFSAEIKF